MAPRMENRTGVVTMTMRMWSTPRFGCPPWEISEAKHIVDVGCVRFNVSHVIVDVVATVDDRWGGCGRFGSSRSFVRGLFS